MIKIIYAQEELEIEGKSIFLAGPSPRDKDTLSWRPGFLKALETVGFNGTVLTPVSKQWSNSYAFDSQIEWEWEAVKLQK